MSEPDSSYYMTISLNVLNHLGLNLYSNTPAVLAEVIANSWDADATEVDVQFDLEKKTIAITDNGCGMDREDINSKYLYVGYQKRPVDLPQGKEFLTPKRHRRPMGRKGIGKLSLFSIANQISVCSRKPGGQTEAFLMDAKKIKAAIDCEDPSQVRSYAPEPVKPSCNYPHGHGTSIRNTDLKKLKLTEATVLGLRRRIARRFSIIGDASNFAVKVNGEPITLTDRDYFHKARFIYQYGADYAQHCNKLERDEDDQVTGEFTRLNTFDLNDQTTKTGPFSIKGWIAIARRSNDLDGDGLTENDNLNKITVVVRGKVALEDILQTFRIGGMITKYIFGEIEADFLDLDHQPDIATSGRQSISEDDERYKALATFVRSELNAIWTETNKLKDRAGLKDALSSNPYVKKWYEALPTQQLKHFAKRIFGEIDRAGFDESQRQRVYASGVLWFEHLKMNHTLHLLEKIDITKVDEFLTCLGDVDALEAQHYRQIVEERLEVIRKLRQSVDENAKERILQEYIFDHLFLLDPSWERATNDDDMERRIERVFQTKEKKRRADIHYIKYRRVAAAHVIVEFKRSSVTVTKTDLESQVREYMDALREEIQKSPKENAALPIQAVCVVGTLPKGWNVERTRQLDETALQLFSIRVITYDELIDNAFAVYGKFLAASKSTGRLRNLIDQIRDFDPNARETPAMTGGSQ